MITIFNFIIIYRRRRYRLPAFCGGLCLCFFLAGPALAQQTDGIVYYRLELTSTQRNRGVIQPDGSARHHLTLHASDGYVMPEAPEAYYVITKTRPRMRRGAQPAQEAPLPPPAAYRAHTRLEDAGWAVETAAGGQVQVGVYVKVRRDGKDYYTSTSFSVYNVPSPEYVQPPGISLPGDWGGWPTFRLELPNRETNWRVEAPMKISFDAKQAGSDGTLVIADSMNKNLIPLTFDEGGKFPALTYTPPDDPMLNSSGRSNKQVTLVAPLSGGGNASISTSISRNSQLHLNRTAGFITAGASFAGALLFALFMRARFKEPHRRVGRAKITAGAQNAN